MKDYILHIPEGVKDLLWEEAQFKACIEQEVKGLFYKHHYQLIETPTFEYIDVWTRGDETVQNPRLYKWVNQQGEVVALRSDMTKSIARVVATQNRTKAFPQRYAYVSNSFRYPERYQGKQHEFTQAGIELIGDASYQSDAEVIMLAIEAIRSAGIEDFSIHIGSADFLKAMLAALGAEQKEEEAIYKAIEAKDAVGLKNILTQLDHTGEVVTTLVSLMQRSGDRAFLEEVREGITSQAARDALSYLTNLYHYLEAFEVADYILFDFSILSFASYYTGIMFQGFTAGIGDRKSVV